MYHGMRPRFRGHDIKSGKRLSVKHWNKRLVTGQEMYGNEGVIGLTVEREWTAAALKFKICFMLKAGKRNFDGRCSFCPHDTLMPKKLFRNKKRARCGRWLILVYGSPEERRFEVLTSTQGGAWIHTKTDRPVCLTYRCLDDVLRRSGNKEIAPLYDSDDNASSSYEMISTRSISARSTI